MLGRVIDIVWVLFVIGILAVLGSDYGELILMLLLVYFLFGS